MSQEKELKRTFQESIAILDQLNKKLAFGISLPESTEEPYKIRMLRALNNIHKILENYSNKKDHLNFYQSIIGVKKLILPEVNKFTSTGIPKIIDRTTYLLTIAYQKALIEIKEYFVEQSFQLFSSYPEELQKLIDQISEKLNDSLYAERAKALLAQLAQTDEIDDVSKKPTAINIRWSEERKHFADSMSIQREDFFKKFSGLEQLKKEKQSHLLGKQTDFQTLSDKLEKSSESSNRIQLSINEKDNELTKLIEVSQSLSSVNKKNAKEVLDSIHSKIPLINLLAILNITSFLNEEKRKLSPEDLLAKLLSSKEQSRHEHIFKKINDKIAALTDEIEHLQKQKNEYENNVALLNKERTIVSKEIFSLEQDITLITKKILDNSSQNVFADDNDLEYYDQVIAENRSLQEYEKDVHSIEQEIMKLEFDSKDIYPVINTILIRIEKYTNNIKALVHGIEETKKTSLLDKLSTLASTVVSNEKEMTEEFKVMDAKENQIKLIKKELEEKGIKNIFPEKINITVFQQFWDQKLDEYWDFRSQKYAFKDVLSCCFFKNDKVRRHEFIADLKALLKTYRCNDHDQILEAKIQCGLKEFKTGIFSNVRDDFKNLHGLLTKLQQSMEIMHKQMPTLRDIKKSTITFLRN